MASTDGENRLIAICESCGEFQVARRIDDGDIVLIGTGRECRVCGSSEFTPASEFE